MLASGTLCRSCVSILRGTICALVAFTSHLFAAEDIRFSRDVLPILSDRCFQCHGPDETHREADLRLDDQASATADRDGHAVVVSGKPEVSELITRVTSEDADLVMPPRDSKVKPLSPEEIATLSTWIAQGAKWGRHWSFEKPQRVASIDSTVRPIDVYIRKRLEREGLKPADRAAKHTLLRRVSFDLTGLPPTLEELDAFLADDSPQAWEKVVDRLLASKHYGERMAMWWLDAARYSDTDGYQGDATRTNWPWRDWVVDAFNSNKPFDQFTIEQFAGDLLPKATPEQKLATCFHRNHMTNGEGGRDPEESRVDYVIDRVNTMGTVWLGLTLGCCQCHSHKFDPVSQHDYYSLFAFFNSIDEDGRAGGGAKPYLKYKSPYAARAVEEAQAVVNHRRPVEAAARQAAEKDFNAWLPSQIAAVQYGFTPWHVFEPTLIESVEGTQLSLESDGMIQATGPNPRQDDYRITAPTSLKRVTGIRLEVFPHANHTDGKLSRGANGEFILTDVKLQLRRRGESQLHDIDMNSAVASAQRSVKGRNYGNVRDTLDDDPRNGWTTEGNDPKKPYTAVFALTEPLSIADDEELVFVMLHRSTRGDANIGRFRLAMSDQPGPAVRSLNPMPLEQLAAAKVTDASKVDAKLRGQLLNQFLSDHADYQQAKAELDRANRQLSSVKRAGGDLNVMVLAERKETRATHVLVRGVWNKKGDEVDRAIPAALISGGFQPSDQSFTRLTLAKWLVSKDNPLTTRVVVNHLWQMCFGSGLVRTPEDFGLQGERPTHPDLLDWLAIELVESGWNLKHILRLIVTTETYRQSSNVTPELLARDPDNRLLTRGARYRLPSWMIRDAALRSSGLFNPTLGGPTVMPYQPDGVWAEMFMGRFRYTPSQGPAQWRRTLYAFWRRSAAPTFLFDSAQRRVCEVGMRRTNTPLHALAQLNDLSQLESARELARQAIEHSNDTDTRLAFVLRSVMSRLPTDFEMSVMRRELTRAKEHYQKNPADAKALTQIGQPEKRANNEAQELAAYSIVTSIIYNTDEAITHE